MTKQKTSFVTKIVKIARKARFSSFFCKRTATKIYSVVELNLVVSFLKKI